jgi:hypothetical protein
MMPWIAFNQDPFSIASNPEDKYVLVYWCVLAQRILTSNHANIDSSSFDNIYLRFKQQKHKDTGYHKKPVNFLHFVNHRTGEDLSTNVSPRSAS